MEEQDASAHPECHQHGSLQAQACAAPVGGSEALCRQSASGHSQEGEYPVAGGEHRGADGYGCHIGGTAEMPRDGGVSKSEQRHRDIADDGGDGDGEDASVHGSFFR